MNDLITDVKNLELETLKNLRSSKASNTLRAYRSDYKDFAGFCFKNGLSSSIKTGLHHVAKQSKAFFICLGDMPDVNQNIYNKLIKSKFKYNKKLKLNHKKEIVVPTYNDQQGNPVLFAITMKNKIMEIDGDNGAESIIQLNKDTTLYVPFVNDGIILDFDTQESFNTL